MEIQQVTVNGRKRAFAVRTAAGTYPFPFAKVEPTASGRDPVVAVYVDPELSDEGFTYRLRSGLEGSVHIDSVLEVNRDPEYMTELLLYKLSLAAKGQLDTSGMPVRDVAKALGTSPAQIYRLVDPTNYTKSLRQLVSLLTYLGCDVDITVNLAPTTQPNVTHSKARVKAEKRDGGRTRVRP